MKVNLTIAQFDVLKAVLLNAVDIHEGESDFAVLSEFTDYITVGEKEWAKSQINELADQGLVTICKFSKTVTITKLGYNVLNTHQPELFDDLSIIKKRFKSVFTDFEKSTFHSVITIQHETLGEQELEIHELPCGALVGIDSSFLDQVGETINSPYNNQRVTLSEAI